jgi:hypothetical protein
LLDHKLEAGAELSRAFGSAVSTQILFLSQLAACVEAIKIDDPTRIVILSGLCEGSAFAACLSPPTAALAKSAHADAHNLFFG